MGAPDNQDCSAVMKQRQDFTGVRGSSLGTFLFTVVEETGGRCYRNGELGVCRAEGTEVCAPSST